MPATNRYRRLWSYGSNTLVASLVFLAILVFVIMIVEKHPWRVDLTESGKYTLSDQTRKVLDSLKQPVTIKAFFRSTEQERAAARDLLDTFHYYSDKITYEFVDPDLRPEIARQYEVRDYGTLVIEGFNKKQNLQKADEESLANALFKLGQEQVKKIYFVVGHGEHSIEDSGKNGYSTVQEALEKQNYEVGELNLLRVDQVPEDASAVIIAGPRKPLMDNEIAHLKQYLAHGGKLMVMLDPYQDAGLKDLVQSYGLELYDDEIVDKLSRVIGGGYLMPVVTQYGAHKITDGFNVFTLYPEARSVRTAKQAPAGVRVLTLASTSEGAWAEMDRDMLQKGQASFDEKVDKAGPVPIVALAEIDKSPTAKADANADANTATDSSTPSATATAGEQPPQTSPGKAYLVVCGNSAFVSNASFGVSGNGDFFLNIANYLAEEESLITIERREKKGQPLVLTRGQERALFWMSLVLMPCAVLVVGTVVYRVRRSQR